MKHWKNDLPDWYIKKHGYQPCINIGTAGHVDHGKTTLVQSLTGVWTSMHSQELKRGITIRVGYSDVAFYKCPKCSEPEGYSTESKCSNCGKKSDLSRVVSIVDSPGHESLMANMLSGAALMDGSILVIGADQKVPQLQTEEHLLALQILGIKQIIVAQNKIDLLTYEEAIATHSEMKKFMTKFNLDAPIIPVSAQSGLNKDALIGAIESQITTPKRDSKADPIMHVLRSFDVNRPGTNISKMKGGIIGGSLTAGMFKVGDEIEIKPGVQEGKKNTYNTIVTKIDSLGTGAGLVESVLPGGLVAIGTKLDPSMASGDALIGAVIGKPGTLPDSTMTASFKTNLFDSAVGMQSTAKVQPIKTGDMLRFSIGTSPELCKVTKTGDGKITVEFRRPVCTFKKGRAAISSRIADRWRLIGAGTVA
ncbi:MAG: translation initiation factor IF-2 subunit gamma [Cenarchaeum symbiont of Oopsacas minuta]|nr:translation initiation factor IF-2 subunit gamma [Cenarchaeum symbiont of Oopsacas minuta]